MKPLVSILMPTYNRSSFFKQALISALNQTYSNIEVIVCDNSENDLTETMIQPFLSGPQGSKINYTRNPTNIGPIANQHKCYDLSKGTYLNYLMDDDLFHPKKIEKMMECFFKYKDVALVTSRRTIIDAHGKVMKVSPGTKMYAQDTVVDGNAIISLMLRDTRNYLGEPTTVLFQKQYLKEPFGCLFGKQAYNNVDIASWISLLAHRKAVYMPEPLCSFRIHKSQLSNSLLSDLGSLCDWVEHICLSRRNRLISSTDFALAITKIKPLILESLPQWNVMTKDRHLHELVRKLRDLIAACEKTDRLSDATKEFKGLLARMEQRIKKPDA